MSNARPPDPSGHRKARVYCSGPLFSPEERGMMALIARSLEQEGFSTFLPQRDGLEMAAMRLGALPGSGARIAAPVERRVRRAIFSLDVFELVERCGALVMSLNGRVPDEGAAVEAGIAFATGTPVVLYKDDARTVFDGHDNPMLTGLSTTFSTVGSVAAIPAAVEEALTRAARRNPVAYTPPPEIATTLVRGRRAWKLLSAARARSGSRGEPNADEVALLVELGEAVDDAPAAPA